MSSSSPKRKLTKAGVALSADARSKLQQVARWMTAELKANQDPKIRLGYSGGLEMNTTNNVTVLSPFGVLVQMFDPMNVADLKQLRYNMYVARTVRLHARAAEILGINNEELLMLLRYMLVGNWSFEIAIKQLRTLK